MTPKTFVVPLDGSEFAERAVAVAAGLVHQSGGGMLLMTALERGPLHPREYLDEIAQRYADVPIQRVVDADQYAADAIVHVLDGSPDRIACMTSHGRGGLRWGIVGSVAEEVVRRSTRPTVLVGRHCREDFLSGARHMLVCTDGSTSSAQLARVVSEWAEQLKLDLNAAIVVHPLDVESAEHPEILLDPIVEQFGGADRVTAKVLTGRYVEGTLADYADDLPAAIIAVNCHGRTGLARFALGSTTMGLLHQASCPLLVTSLQPAEGR
jgi:nucleotide-binding universal stress UspA family protein